MRRYQNPKSTLKFVLIAIIMMVLADYAWTKLTGKTPEGMPAPKSIEDVILALPPDATPVPVTPEQVAPEAGSENFFTAALPEDIEEQLARPLPDQQSAPAVVPVPAAPALPVLPEGGRPKIVIIIDDMGVDVRHSRQVIALSGPLTLAFLPYAEKAKELAAAAAEAGHERIIHVPMEAMNTTMDLGPLALRTSMSDAELRAEFEKIAATFEGYVGINNHMGSRLTQDKRAMAVIMDLLKESNMVFVDSKTIQTSVAEQVAKEFGVPHASRDVFLDHRPTASFVSEALAETERIARRKGVAIAIGHPKPATIEGLKAWLPTLKDKGFDLVPVSAAVARPARQAVSAAPAPQPVPLPQ